MHQDQRQEGWKVRLLQPRLPWTSQQGRPADVSEGLVSTMLARENLLEDANYQKIVPNRFIVELSEENYTRNYQMIEGRVIRQWSDRLLDRLSTANSRQGKREYYFGGRVLIEIRPAPDLQSGQVRILCKVQADSAGERAAPTACLELALGRRRWSLRPGITTVGRDESCTIYLDLADVQERRLISGQHAYLLYRDGQHRLYDGSPQGKPSLNGTFVNGVRVPPEGRVLQNGDAILLAAPDPSRPVSGVPGTVTFRFLIHCPD